MKTELFGFGWPASTWGLQEKILETYGRRSITWISRWQRRRLEKRASALGSIVRPLRKAVMKFSLSLKDVSEDAIRSRLFRLPLIPWAAAGGILRSCIYVVYDGSIPFYVGQTASLKDRLISHLSSTENGVGRYVAQDRGLFKSHRCKCGIMIPCVRSLNAKQKSKVQNIVRAFHLALLPVPGFSEYDRLRMEALTINVIQPRYGG